MSQAQAHADKVTFIVGQDVGGSPSPLPDRGSRPVLSTVRRLDGELTDTKANVVAKAVTIKGDLDSHADVLAHVAGHPFYNSSRFTFETLLDDPEHITENVFDYLQGFSPNARFALNKFGIEGHVEKMGEAGILFMVIQRFAGIDLHPDTVSNLEMGYIYEHLIRVNAQALQRGGRRALHSTGSHPSHGELAFRRRKTSSSRPARSPPSTTPPAGPAAC